MNQQTLDKKLIKAVEKGNLKRVKHLIEKGANVHAGGYDTGPFGDELYFEEMPLLEAMTNGHLKIAEYLLEHGADATYDYMQEFSGAEPLADILERGNVKLAKLLMKYGREIEGGDENISIITGISSQKNKKKILEFMLQEVGAPLKYALPGTYMHWHPKGLRGLVVWYKKLNTDLSPDQVRDLGIILKEDQVKIIPEIFLQHDSLISGLPRHVSNYL